MTEERHYKTLTRILPLLLGMGLAIPACGQEIGTLFTSPEEREYLDYLREENLRQSRANTFNIQEDVIPDIPTIQNDEAEEVRPEVALYKFGGIMVRRNGSRLVWLNGAQVAERDLPGNMSLVVSGSESILNIRANGNVFRLKPGQTADVTGNRVLEPFQQSMTPASQPQDDSTQESPDSRQPQEAEEATLAAAEGSAPEQEELSTILQRLNPGTEEYDQDQLQEALDVLSQQQDAQQ
jgi:hypothetical protein